MVMCGCVLCGLIRQLVGHNNFLKGKGSFMAEMMFYNKLVSLDAKVHGDLRVKPGMGVEFASKTNSVPVVAVEFADLAREFPIVFVKGSDDLFMPVALLGLRENENLFVNAENKWDGRYLPAFIRRYPFVPAEVKQGEMVVCIDETAACFNKEEGEMLFDGDQATPFLQGAIGLLQEYQQTALRTQEFSKKLQDFNLLVESNAEIKTPTGESFRLSGLFVIDEKRLQVLDKDRVHALFASGELGLIYAQMLSLGNLQRLVEKLVARLAAK